MMSKVEKIFESAEGPLEINVFDFDDTLVKTKSSIHMTNARGESVTMTPAEYAVYEPQSGDHFDFSDFEHLKSPTPIAHMVLKLNYAIRNWGAKNVFILTARGNPAPIRAFLNDMGMPNIRIYALGDGDPQAKAEVIRREILLRKNVAVVRFYDDSAKNIAAVNALQREVRPTKIIAVKIG
jgi:hypothetical protein